MGPRFRRTGGRQSSAMPAERRPPVLRAPHALPASKARLIICSRSPAISRRASALFPPAPPRAGFLARLKPTPQSRSPSEPAPCSLSAGSAIPPYPLSVFMAFFPFPRPFKDPCCIHSRSRTSAPVSRSPTNHRRNPRRDLFPASD